MTRWTSDPDGAAAALIMSCLTDIAPMQFVLWVGGAGLIAGLRPSPAPTLWSRRFTARGPGTAEPPAGPFAMAVLRLPKSRAEQMMTVHQCLGVLAPDGRLIVYGGNDEGIRSLQKAMGELGATSVRAARGHGRVLELRRADVVVPLKPRIGDWRHTHIAIDGGTSAPWISYPGLFAGGAPDPGTTLLQAHLPKIADEARVLDFGCGPGAIAAHIRRTTPRAQLTLLDNDSVALLAASENVAGATMMAGDRLAAVGGQRFDLIVSNPPLHVGFRDDTTALQRLIAEAPEHLAPGGCLTLVVQRRIPLDHDLSKAFRAVTCVADDGAYRVWHATR